MILGAIVGDIIGSYWEFKYEKPMYNFNLFNDESRPTDDSFLTLAFMEMFNNEKEINHEVAAKYLRKWGNIYPDGAYGCSFSNWLKDENYGPYNSKGNGAAMRISSVGWVAKSEEEVKKYSRILTEITHNHPFGILYSEVTAMCVFFARIGKDKKFIKDYVSQYFNVDFNFDDLCKNYDFSELIEETVPQAIYCFLISDSFDDCVRKSMMIGGDSDTLSAISCSIADAFYKKIPEEILSQALSRLDKNCLNVVTEFSKKFEK
mgnify:CR=1 FL=1